MGQWCCKNILKEDRAACEEYASEFLDNLYAFESGEVLFKPTKCEIEQFRNFIAGDDRACNEDKGFAINPWTKVRFENSGIIIDGDRAIAIKLLLY